MKHDMTEQEWTAKKDDIIRILSVQARMAEPTPITYKELCRQMQLPPAFESPQASFELRDLLDEIDRDEAALGRGMLTSLIHNEELNQPGNGFFLLAKKLGFEFDRTEEGRLKFAIEQIQRVSFEQGNNQSGGS